MMMVMLAAPTHKQIKLMRLMTHVAVVPIIVNAVSFAVDDDDT